MTNGLPINAVISQVDVLEETNDTGDGGYSYEKCFDVCDLDDDMRDEETSRSGYFIVEGLGIDQVGNEEENTVLLQFDDIVNIYLVKMPKVPDDWVNLTPNENKREPYFSEVDNPGIWSRFYFQPTFERGR